MTNKIYYTLFLSIAFCLVGCLEGSENSTNSASALENGSSPHDISVFCSPAMSPECDAPSNGEETYFIWAESSCEALTLGLEEEDIAALGVQSLNCDATGCGALGDSPWASLDSPSPVTFISSNATTAAAWLNFTDNGSGDDQGPQTGDVLCCLEEQNSDVDLTNADCVPIF